MQRLGNHTCVPSSVPARELLALEWMIEEVEDYIGLTDSIPVAIPQSLTPLA